MNYSFGFMLLEIQLFSLKLAGLKLTEHSSIRLKLYFSLKISHLLYISPIEFKHTMVPRTCLSRDISEGNSHLTKTNKKIVLA